MAFKKINLAVVLGSGLSGAEIKLRKLYSVSYAKLGIRTCKTIKGRGRVMDVYDSPSGPVAVFKGRAHYYENPAGSDHLKITLIARKHGAKKILFTHAAGSLRKDIKAGDIVLVKDHINLTFTNPFLTGALDIGKTGPFCDLRGLYENSLTRALSAALKSSGIKYKQGIYAGVSGPLYETRAEAAFFRKIGADVAGMSLVQEALQAFFLGMECSSLVYVTNNLVTGKSLSHGEVVRMSRKALGIFGRIISQLASEI